MFTYELIQKSNTAEQMRRLGQSQTLASIKILDDLRDSTVGFVIQEDLEDALLLVKEQLRYQKEKEAVYKN